MVESASYMAVFFNMLMGWLRCSKLVNAKCLTPRSLYPSPVKKPLELELMK